jgi:hypothetical protein
MISRLISIFRCPHPNFTFPRSPRKGTKRPDAAVVTGCYVVCTECGRELPYDWNEMRVVSERELRKTYGLHVSQESRVN